MQRLSATKIKYSRFFSVIEDIKSCVFRANNASSIVLDIEREKYPIFTIKTEENNNKNR